MEDNKRNELTYTAATELLLRKLRLICRYCGDGAGSKAMAGMNDVPDILTSIVTVIIQVRPASAALIGSLTLVLDAMQSGDMQALQASLESGLIPELEQVKGALKDKGSIALGGPDSSKMNFKTDVSSATCICLFGYGDGAYYEELCRQAPEGATFIAYEPETDTVPELREQLQSNVDYYKLETMRVLATPGYDVIFRTELAEFMHAVNENRERILVNKNTLKRFKDSASRNVITNLPVLKKCNLVGELAHILPRSVPVIIVSAGPSLDKNIELLRKAKGHCLIFAVDTAMKYMMERDIMPDLGITVEPIKPMANYADDRCFDVPHIFDCESNPEIVSRERGRIFIYNCRDYVRRILESVGVEVADDVPSGGSVATAAFAICCQLQVRTIIMIGQDLAYQGTATHAGGVESSGINGDIGCDMVDGIDGNPVRTRSDWTGYLRWFENAIRDINAGKLDMTVVDATEGGALIHGSHVMRLEDALEKYCLGDGQSEGAEPVKGAEACNYDFAEALKHLPYMLDDEAAAEVDDVIAASFEELKGVKQAAGEAVRLCDNVMENASQVTGLQKAGPGAALGTVGVRKSLAELSKYRRTCEAALMYPLINNYAVSDIIDEISRLRNDASDSFSEIKQQRLAFTAIAEACDYFMELGAVK